MTKTQLREQKSIEWKKANGWGLSPAERTARTIKAAQKSIDEKLAEGKDASILMDLLNELKKEF